MVSLYPLGVFGSCTAILIYWSGLQQKGSFKSCPYGVSSDFLDGMGFISFGLDCTLLFVLATIGSYRAMNYSFHGAALFVHL
uniref:Putative ovule protein n=1 Tax=Solanum chacoense TaxID=4108 RepID=A0A0V0ITN7_SOLCH